MRELRTEYQLVVRIRPIDLFAVVSILLHAAFFVFTKINVPLEPEGPLIDRPLNVVLASPRTEPAPEVTAPSTAPQPSPQAPQILARKPSPQAPRTPGPVVPQAPPVEPTLSREPLVDMMASIEATRAQRQAAEAAAARGAPSDPGEDPASRNARSLSGREGVGGIFQIMRKGLRTGEFAFNGFRGQGRRWREVIEVDAGPGGDVELAMVRRMIELIRGHYSGDFRWESHRLGRVVVLSARPADQAGLEEFMLKEFFGAPPPTPSARAGRPPMSQ
jgi:hypothetical protein